MKRARKKNQKIKAPKTKGVSKVKLSKKGKRKRAKIIAAVLVCLLVVVFIGLGFGGGGDNALIPIDTSTGKMNVLLMGVDEDGLRTDAMMLASYDFDEESLKLLSIPRDTKVYVTNKKVTRKINEVHAMSKKGGGIMGPLASIEAVSALTGVPISYYVEFSFDAIDEIMEILGPVTFEVPDIEGNGKGMNYDDPTQDLHIHLKPGLQELSGNQVQQFLRYRKSNSGTVDGSDTSRVQRQQEFVKALIDQKVNMSLIVKAPDIYSQVKKNIKTNFSAGEIAKYSTHLLNLTQENITTYSLPGADKHTSAWYFECDLDETQTLIETEFGYDASDITNKMEITGEKYKASKSSKTEDSEKKKNNDDKSSDTSKKTSAPKKTSKPDDDDDEPKKTQKPTSKPKAEETQKTEETVTPKKTAAPEKTKEPVRETAKPKKTEEPTKEPVKKTEEPEKTAEPLRPTAKPSQESEESDIEVIED